MRRICGKYHLLPNGEREREKMINGVYEKSTFVQGTVVL